MRRRVRGIAGRWHRPTDCKAHDVFEGDHPAVDDRQIGGDATGFDRLAVVAAEASATRIDNVKPPRPIEGNVLRAWPKMTHRKFHRSKHRLIFRLERRAERKLLKW